MNIRKRITIDETIYNAAVEYSKLDNRTISELIQEALKQMMRRYPKKEMEPGPHWRVTTPMEDEINRIKVEMSILENRLKNQ